MFKRYKIISLLLVLILLTSCGAPATTIAPTAPAIEEAMSPVSIVRHPGPVDYSDNYLELTSIPKFDPNSTDPWQIDLRSRDLTKIDMTDSLADLMYADFDSKTQWPSSDKMPVGFDWQKIMEFGNDPGLGMRALHEQGFTGKGVGIAIIDQTLLVDHIEYKDQIRVYEEAADVTGGWVQTSMHGPAVASIAVGKTVGVAPEADLYFIAHGSCGIETINIADWDFSCLAQAIRRVIEINKSLPSDRKIKVISMSIGWTPENIGYKEIMDAVNEAKSAGIFVISTSLGGTYELYFHGLGRYPLDDPNSFEPYIPGIWWVNNFYAGKPMNRYSGDGNKPTLLIPMDSRTTASLTGTEDYAFYRVGGWSWSVPYLAGTYALAVQVKPDITPEEFWAIALETGKTTQITHDGKDYSFGVILDPQALIAALQK